MIIAIDGPAAAGKGTLARRLSKHLNLAYLDTGLIYRAIGKRMLVVEADPKNAALAESEARAMRPEDLKLEGLRTDEVAQVASMVSALPGVRAALLEFQRNFATCPPDGKAGAVLDGRDIGTVVCPEAPHKLFITASMEVRARRRVKELQNRGLKAIYARVLEDMKERDARDRRRAVSPLEPASDAHTLDTSDWDVDQVFQAALDLIRSPNA